MVGSMDTKRDFVYPREWKELEANLKDAEVGIHCIYIVEASAIREASLSPFFFGRRLGIISWLQTTI